MIEPALYYPAVLAIIIFCQGIFFALFASVMPPDKESYFDVAVTVFSFIAMLIFSFAMVALFKEYMHILRLKRLQIEEEVQAMKKNEDTASRLYQIRISRIFEVLQAIGEGIPPTPSLENGQIVEPEQIVEPAKKIELIQDSATSKEYYFKVEGESGKVEYSSIAQWEANAYSKYKNDLKNSAKYQEIAVIYRQARTLRNREFVRRYIELYSVDIRNSLLSVYFREPRTGQTPRYFCLRGKPTTLMFFLEKYIEHREIGGQAPTPQSYHVSIEPYNFADSMQANQVGYGCVFNVVAFTIQDAQ